MIGNGNTGWSSLKSFSSQLTPTPSYFGMGDDERKEHFKNMNKSNRSDLQTKTMPQEKIL